MRKNTIIMGATLFFSLILFSLCLAEESFTITTYYPSPYGSYNDLYVANRLGIGTTGPNAKLHVKASGILSGYNIHATDSNNATTFILFDTGLLYLNNPHGGDHLQIGNHALHVKGNGNVGVGTASPTQKLDVAGNATISGTVRGATYGFGGMYQTGNAPKNNPITGAQNCPSGFATVEIFSEDCGGGNYCNHLYLCWK